MNHVLNFIVSCNGAAVGFNKTRGRWSTRRFSTSPHWRSVTSSLKQPQPAEWIAGIIDSVPVISWSTLGSSNFSSYVLRFCLQTVWTFNGFIISSFIFTGWVSSWIWTVISSVLWWNGRVSGHPPLFKNFWCYCCCCCSTVVSQHRANNFSRPCTIACCKLSVETSN